MGTRFPAAGRIAAAVAVPAPFSRTAWQRPCPPCGACAPRRIGDEISGPPHRAPRESGPPACQQGPMLPARRCSLEEPPTGGGSKGASITRRRPGDRRRLSHRMPVHHSFQNGLRVSDSASARVRPMSCSILSSSMASFAQSRLRRRHSRKSATARSTAPPDLHSAAARRQVEKVCNVLAVI